MGAAMPLIALGLGVYEGVSSYQAGKDAARIAEANAAMARQMQDYERRVQKQNIALIQGDEKQAITEQEYLNEQVMGSVTASMGASGVQTTGTFLDVLAETVILGMNQNAVIRSKSLRQQTAAENSGNMAVFQNEYAEYSYMVAADQAKRKATMGLLMGIGKGLVGFKMAGGEFGSFFGQKTLLTQASGQLGLSQGGLFGSGNLQDIFGYDELSNYFAATFVAP